jgi:hypothetical protein
MVGVAVGSGVDVLVGVASRVAVGRTWVISTVGAELGEVVVGSAAEV